jgi:hypothetical protein
LDDQRVLDHHATEQLYCSAYQAFQAMANERVGAYCLETKELKESYGGNGHNEEKTSVHYTMEPGHGHLWLDRRKDPPNPVEG